MSYEVVTTTGGSRAILDHTTGEVMHPIIGPRAESRKTYIDPSRLAERLAEEGPPLVLFDVGLGAGSVAIAAWHASEARAVGRVLEIVSYDRDLAALELAIEHGADFELDGKAGEAARALIATGEHRTAHTHWRYVGGELPAVFTGHADLIFWDAYSPKRNVELWDVAAFTAVRAHANEGCVLHTYSGATAVRSALLLAGFTVGVGVPVGAGKFGTMAAVAPATVEQPLDARWLERLRRSSAAFPHDAPADAMERIAALAQLQKQLT